MASEEPGAPTRRLAVWDPWVRLVHWLLVVLVPLSWWSAETERFRLHFLSGYAILTLVLFRIGWGLVGSETARFARFLRGPGAALRHLAHLRDRAAVPEIGHNAAGGWMVLLLLALLLIQATTGLFADDQVLTKGPLAEAVDPAWSDRATSVHLTVFWVILGCVVLHVLAVLAYRLFAGRNLVKPMLTGRLEVPAAAPVTPPRLGRAWLAVLLLLAAAAAVFRAAREAPLPML